MLKERKISIGSDGGYVENTRLQNHIVGVIVFNHCDGDAGRVIGNLDSGIDDTAVVFAVIMCG